MSDSHSANSTVSATGNPVDALWGLMTLDNGNAVWFATVGIILQAMLISSIIGKTFEYLDYFKKRDNKYMLWGVATGTVLSLVTLGITCAEAYVMVHQKTLNTASAVRFLLLGDITNLFLGTLFNLAACIYYSWRAYKMLGSRRWTIGIFAVCLTAQFVSAMVAAGDGYTCPVITPETLQDLQDFMHRNVKEFQIWGSITTAVDGSLCILMTIMLFKSRDGIFHRETRLFNKLISLVYETMLPPVVCLLLYQASTKLGGNPLSDFRKIITCILPVLYFHSLLHTLVGRKRIRQILEANLARDGVNVISDRNRDNYKGSNSGKFDFAVTGSKSQRNINFLNENEGGRVLGGSDTLDVGGFPPTSPKSFIWDGRR
ncbi:hypothetical protein I302_107052 [Kwoniella bestiolae CBS 10118]|uniref:DUF6534 domain-containing protein n=1 Tax=Kwoniella bestiolae CBS 10118 TaxID=1296100 RepID=A0A1B9FZM3_9TREE|nr:hypothetical protein I302_05683 [Kwoniella bestiolae CBS 10118]OCF24224.1 hypothetical protein I302_05683 [Kwoniella bestiolae CBS 10118]